MWKFRELFCIDVIFERFTNGLLSIAITSLGSEK